MSAPSQKRRRTDEARARRTLSKPFRSPLRSSSSPIRQALPDAIEAEEIGKPTANSLARPLSSPVLSPHQNPTASPPSLPPTGKQFLCPTQSPSKDPAEQVIARQNSALNSQIAVLRDEVETLSQAAKIQSSSRDEELEALILKWRGVCREVAEELFVECKVRVDRMGGVGAWRDIETKKREKLSGNAWYEADKSDGVDDAHYDRDDGEREYGYHDLSENEKNALEDEGRGDDSFTMDMMLRSLNIELNVIGYDKEEQRWVD